MYSYPGINRYIVTYFSLGVVNVDAKELVMKRIDYSPKNNVSALCAIERERVRVRGGQTATYRCFLQLCYQ